MATKKKAPPKRKAGGNKNSSKSRSKNFRPPAKPKLPTLGSGLVGLGGTGGGGMIP
jgi:hypothetical protein